MPMRPSKYYRDRAEEALVVAEELTVIDRRLGMLDVVAQYRWLARQAEGEERVAEQVAAAKLLVVDAKASVVAMIPVAKERA